MKGHNGKEWRDDLFSTKCHQTNAKTPRADCMQVETSNLDLLRWLRTFAYMMHTRLALASASTAIDNTPSTYTLWTVQPMGYRAIFRLRWTPDIRGVKGFDTTVSKNLSPSDMHHGS